MMSDVFFIFDLPLFSPRSHWNSAASHTFPDANVLLQLCAVGLRHPLRCPLRHPSFVLMAVDWFTLHTVAPSFLPVQ